MSAARAGLRPGAVSGSGGASLAGVVVALMAGYLVALAWSMENTSYDAWGAMALAPVLVALTVPLARRAARREDDPTLARIIISALCLKLLGSLVRYAVAYEAYQGVADAAGYDRAGRELAPLFRSGVLEADIGSKVIGTGFVKILTGVVYTFVGPTEIGGFLVFSWLGFWGLYLFYRAFCIAVPTGDRRRYALLVFFLPSLLFWPSSIGKEAWITLTLGLTAYAGARLVSGRRGAFSLLALGLLGTVMIRPHVALVAFGAVVVGFLVGRAPNRTPFARFARLSSLVVLVGFTVALLTQVQDFFRLDTLDGQSVDQVLSMTEGRTTQGGSEFEAPRATSVAQMPRAVVSVLFRPFPFEARNAQAMVASAEGALLLVLFVQSRRRIASALRRLRATPYAALSLSYVLLFAFAFSSFGNFGIIARQRVQMLPFALVFLALPLAPGPADGRKAPASAGAARPEPVGVGRRW